MEQYSRNSIVYEPILTNGITVLEGENHEICDLQKGGKLFPSYVSL